MLQGTYCNVAVDPPRDKSAGTYQTLVIVVFSPDILEGRPSAGR